MAETFNFPYHTPQDEYPGGSTIKFGRGYRFAAKPPGPPEVIVHLNFPNMFVYINPDGTVNYTVEPTLNIFALETFYQKVEMYAPFNYAHHRKGTVIARFNKPLIMPKTIKTPNGDSGFTKVGSVVYRTNDVEAFDLELILQP